MKTTMITNFCILIAPFLLAIFYPQVGKLAGYLGSFSALGCIYVMPTITHLKSVYTQIKHPILAEAILQNKFEYKSADIPTSPIIEVDKKFVREKMKDKLMQKGGEIERKKAFQINVAITSAIILFGLYVVIA